MIIKKGLKDFPGMTITPDRYETAVMNDEPILAKKWRNLWFLKDGRCIEEPRDYPNEVSAQNCGDRMMDEWKSEVEIYPFRPLSMAGVIIGILRDLSHFIPMPIK